MEEEQALLALYDLESHVLPHLQNIEQSDPTVRYCMEQAKFHLDAARDLLSGAVLDPQTHYDDALEFYRILKRVLPLMVLFRSFEPPLPDHNTEENLSDTQLSDQSDADNFELESPPHLRESESF